ncbi:hypothetical protein BDW74DRAFT_179087 [Aspergillus multicolor]|uniref:uncharacterized protein n=1 Tax=Aspergillus multicolor TaxID=41759 RepID=UPI003CCCC38A
MSAITCRGAQPAIEAAKVLDLAGIDHMCVGWLAVALLAFDATIGEVELAVRDKNFAAARAALVKGGFVSARTPIAWSSVKTDSPRRSKSSKGSRDTCSVGRRPNGTPFAPPMRTTRSLRPIST